MVQIEAINNINDLLRLKAIWNDLLKHSGSATPFLTFEWLTTWWDCYNNGKQLFVLIAREDGEIVGIAPLYIEKKVYYKLIPLKKICFLGTGISDYLDFFIAKNREQVLNAFFNYLYTHRKLWSILRLREINESSPNFPILQNIVAQNSKIKLDELNICPYIEISKTWDSYYASLSKNFRQDLRTQFNRMKKNDVSYKILKDTKDFDGELLNQLLTIHLQNITAKNKTSFLQTAAGKKFLTSILTAWQNEDICILYSLKIGENIAAYALCFRFEKKMYYWLVGIEREYEFYSPGKILLHDLLLEIFRLGILIEFDLLRGEEEYKYRWTDKERKNYQIIINGNRAYSKFLISIQFIFKQLASFYLLVKNVTDFERSKRL